MVKMLAATLFGFLAGVVLAWNYLGPDAEADESTVRFARSVETISDSVVTLELMERSGCDAVIEYHERRLEDSVRETGGMIGDLGDIESLTPDLDEQLRKARDWASEKDLDDLVEGSKRVIDQIRSSE